MSSINFLNDNDEAITELDYGIVSPGEVKSKEIKLENNTSETIEDIDFCPFPGLISDTFENTINTDGDSVQSVRVVRETTGGTLQTVSIAKEDSGSEITAYEERVYCFEYLSSVYTARNTGSVNFMAIAGDKVYLGCNERIFNINVTISTPGSYTGFAIKYNNGTSFVAFAGATDGTSGLTGSGIIQLDKASVALWRKSKVNGKWAYWVEFSCTAVTTQAVASDMYWEYAYNLPKHFIKGEGTYYTKSDAATPTYAEVTPDYIYGNMGRIVFFDNPLAGIPTYTLHAEIDYKIPQAGTYQIDVDSTSTVTVNGGSPIGVSLITGNKNYNIIPGLEIVLKTTLTVSNQAVINISEMLKHLWVSLDDTYNNYSNNDLDCSDLATGSSVPVYTKYIPDVDCAEADNERYLELYARGTV